jgi:hypothetical protein
MFTTGVVEEPCDARSQERQLIGRTGGRGERIVVEHRLTVTDGTNITRDCDRATCGSAS